MAKKTVNFAKLSLPEPPALLKKEEDAARLERAVEQIHRADIAAEPPRTGKKYAPKPTAKTSPIAPTNSKTKAKPTAKPATPSRRQSTAAALPDDELVKKISMDLPVNIYTYVKMRSFQQATTMREFLLGLIREEMRRMPV